MLSRQLDMSFRSSKRGLGHINNNKFHIVKININIVHTEVIFKDMEITCEDRMRSELGPKP